MNNLYYLSASYTTCKKLNYLQANFIHHGKSGSLPGSYQKRLHL